MLTFAAARARGGSAQRALWLRPPPARCRAKSGASSAKGPPDGNAMLEARQLALRRAGSRYSRPSCSPRAKMAARQLQGMRAVQ